MKNSIYQTSVENEGFSTDYEDAHWQIQQLDKQIRKLKKKKKGKKRGKKSKFKRKIRTLEMEQAQLKQFIIFFACQYKEQVKQQPWWQGTICNTLPRALELATATINRLPTKTQLPYLTDGSDRK